MKIETERLLLREFKRADWSTVYEYQNDPRYLQYYAWAERNKRDVEHFVEMFIEQQQESPRTKYQLVVELKKDSQLIGNCGIRMRSHAAEEADIGFEIAPAHWGQGLATEAANAMVAFGFTQLKVHRVSSWCIAENAASGRVLEKLGLRQEGRLRENEYFKARWWDTLLYAILRDDWHPQNNPLKSITE